jgi:LCP family protein required for cell wall assembly
VSPSGLPSAPAPPAATPTADPSPTATPSIYDKALLNGRLTVLVVGQDSDHAREAAGLRLENTDALMVVSLSADKSRISMLGLPRDTVDVPLADGSIYRGKINAIASRYGLEALQGAVERLLRVPVDGYIKIDMDNFVAVVDGVGGVDVRVKTRVYDPGLDLALEPGRVHLDGAMALDYTRSRQDSDYARAARQQQVLLALIRKYANPDTRWSPGGLLAAMDSLATNLDLRHDLPTLVEMARRARGAQVTQRVLAPPRFALFAGIEPGTARGWVMIPDIGEMRDYARKVLSD